IGSPTEVGAHVEATVGEALAKRRAQIRERLAPAEGPPESTAPRERVALPAPHERTAPPPEPAAPPPPPPAEGEGSTPGGSGVTSRVPTSTIGLPAGVPAPRRLGRAAIVAGLAFAVGAVGVVALRSASTQSSTPEPASSAAPEVAPPSASARPSP